MTESVGSDGTAAGDEVRVVLMTAPDPAVAERLARTLVDEQLAACGTIVPAVTSIYRWEGTVRAEGETLVVLKTRAAAVPALLERAPAMHPYEVPEVLVLPVLTGNPRYLEWVRASSRGDEIQD